MQGTSATLRTVVNNHGCLETDSSRSVNPGSIGSMLRCDFSRSYEIYPGSYTIAAHRARSAGLEPAIVPVRSQDTCVCSCIWLFKTRLPKPPFSSSRLQLFTCVTVKSLSTIVASNDQPAAFGCGEGGSSRKLISGSEIHWKPGFREYSPSRRWLNNLPPNSCSSTSYHHGDDQYRKQRLDHR